MYYNLKNYARHSNCENILKFQVLLNDSNIIDARVKSPGDSKNLENFLIRKWIIRSQSLKYKLIQ